MVFQREDAPLDAFYDCRRCVALEEVCRKHQFALYGENGVRRYLQGLKDSHDQGYEIIIRYVVYIFSHLTECKPVEAERETCFCSG